MCDPSCQFDPSFTLFESGIDGLDATAGMGGTTQPVEVGAVHFQRVVIGFR
jgi:hypothetical protein